MSPGDLTVGEVLSLLQGDFPEATMGWIRSVESDGLVVPKRTNRGARLYPPELLGTLRWILEEQRTGASSEELRHSLSHSAGRRRDRAAAEAAEPRLFDDPADILPPVDFDEGPEDADDDVDDDFDDDDDVFGLRADRFEADPSSTTETPAARAPLLRPAEGVDDGPSSRSRMARRAPHHPTLSGQRRAANENPSPASDSPEERTASPVTGSVPVARPSAPSGPPPKAPTSPATPSAPDDATEPSSDPETAQRNRRRVAAAMVAELQEPPAPAEPPERPQPARMRDAEKDSEGQLLTRDEFLEATGLTDSVLGTLEQFGVLAPVASGGFYYYDAHALSVGRIAASFGELGVEARHLRMYRMAAEREVALLEQMALPLLRQRNPVGREQARAILRDAADLGRQMYAALVDEGIQALFRQGE